MENVYRTKFILHIKSLRFVLIGFVISLLVFYFILNSQNEKFSLHAFIFGVLPIFLIFFAPALYLHMTYYFKNFGQKITVDESQSKLTVVKYEKQFSYCYSNIVIVEQHLGIFYRNRIDRLGRRLTPWTPYGYIEIKLDNGLRFQMTSLMVDIQNPPFVITHTYFRFFPYLKTQEEISEKRTTLNEKYKNEISYYKATFKNHTDQQLKEKIIHAKTYKKASVEASKQLLNNRKSKVD